jgi:outer membrane protein OmpA-like peptidoglycan-associated protein
MVIFVLLFLAFVHNQAGKRETVKEDILAELQRQLTPVGFKTDDIRPDKNDPNAVVIIVPERLMNFDSGSSALKPQGQNFLDEKIPTLSAVLWRFQKDIDSIVVEGHTDRQHKINVSQSEGEAFNLQLSQDRSMVVVKRSLHTLDFQHLPDQRHFFLEKLSASGRGEQNASTDPAKEVNEEDRRVIFKIRIRTSVGPEFANEVRLPGEKK